MLFMDTQRGGAAAATLAFAISLLALLAGGVCIL